MLGTLQPPLAIYSSAWLPLILESKTLLNYWFWCPLPLLSIFCPTHNGNSKLRSFLLYSNYLLPWRLITCHMSLLSKKNQDLPTKTVPGVFFLSKCVQILNTSLWISWTLILSDLQYWELQLKVYLLLPEFSHLAANILLISPNFMLRVWCS